MQACYAMLDSEADLPIRGEAGNICCPDVATCHTDAAQPALHRAGQAQYNMYTYLAVEYGIIREHVYRIRRIKVYNTDSQHRKTSPLSLHLPLAPTTASLLPPRAAAAVAANSCCARRPAYARYGDHFCHPRPNMAQSPFASADRLG